MVKLAKKNVPNATFVVKNIMDLRKKEYTVDAVISFYTLFHIPRDHHEDVLEKINSFLPLDGKILLTFGGEDNEIIKDFHGMPNFWSRYSPEKNLELLKKTGFIIIQETIEHIGGASHGGMHQIILGK